MLVIVVLLQALSNAAIGYSGLNLPIHEKSRGALECIALHFNQAFPYLLILKSEVNFKSTSPGGARSNVLALCLSELKFVGPAISLYVVYDY